MKGLLIKDFLSIKIQLTTYILVVAIWGVTFILNSKIQFFSALMTLLTTMVIQTSMALDERCKWDKFGLIMPVSRTQAVYSKYILAVILSAISFAITVVANIIADKALVFSSIDTSVTCFFMSLIIISINLPVIFRFGYEKSKYMLMALLGIPIALIVIIMELQLFNDNMVMVVTNLLNYIPFLAVIIMGISIYLSINFYYKKEF
ncbi:MAG: ABC-2 transporter permease [Clostridia bacterium]